MNKQVLREIYLEKRLFLSEEEKKRRDLLLVKHFLESFKLSGKEHLHIFLPILKKKEPNTLLLIEEIQKRHPDLKVVIPKSENGGKLRHYIYAGEGQLKLNKWDIPEPQYGVEVSPQELDIVLIPLIIFDKKGHRIGYGKGFYDRFLAQCRPEAKKIGYSLHMPLDFIPYSDDHDFPMDSCVYPDGVFSF